MTRDAASLLASLVAIPSVNPAYRKPGDDPAIFGEAAMADAVASWLREARLDVELDPVHAGRPNVVARLRGNNARRRLIWEGHLDTVQISGMTVPPFAPAIREGCLYGRGAVDDKACLTAFMLALAELARDPAGIDLTFVAAVDEEFHQTGILHHLRRGERFDGGVAGEPTGLRVVSACKGCVRWSIDVRGVPAHSSRPQEGIDAIAIATTLAAHLREHADALGAAAPHALLGPASMVCTMIEGGEGPNTIPAHCRLTFDRRTLPGETGRQAWEEIEQAVQSWATGLPSGAAVTVQPPFIDCPSMEVDALAPIVADARAACRREGLDDTIEGVPFGSDASHMTAAGIPTIVFGPGHIEHAHTADEHVPLAQVKQAARMLADMARRSREG